jgi:TatD DNase family protein
MPANSPKIEIRAPLGPYYDAHCHYQDSRLSSWFAERGSEVEGFGIRKAVVNGTKPEDWADVAKLASKYEYVIPSYGLHPWFVNEGFGDAIKELERLLKSRTYPIGEIGLDRWIQGYDIELQKVAFISQLRLAKLYEVPVAIHCLRAWGMLLKILQEEGPIESGFLLHSYGGPAEMIPDFLEIGACFSISGYFALEGKERKREAFRAVPLERLLVETDCPDMLGPQTVCPARLGERVNGPSNIGGVYEFAAGLFGVPSLEFRDAIEANFLQLFGRWVS